mgnify:CR=1 FL=1
MQKKMQRITAYHKPNGGLSDARNYGLERAHGEYVLFVDSDDYLEPQACAKPMEGSKGRLCRYHHLQNGTGEALKDGTV